MLRKIGMLPAPIEWNAWDVRPDVKHAHSHLAKCATAPTGRYRESTLMAHTQFGGKEIMSSCQESSAFPGSANRTQSPAHPTAPSNPRETRSDPLCGENIDAQIRWFFENALERERLRP
jgi:hypothetical protein